MTESTETLLEYDTLEFSETQGEKLATSVYLNSPLKRSIDILFSLLVLLSFAALLPIIVIMILIDSRGPILFKQERTGLNEKTFYCLKFRTMTNEKNQSERKITRLGNILRLSHIDELPQVFNVLKGEMSFVGPRPHMLADSKDFSSIDKRYYERYLAKPGITGLAQSSGYYGWVNSNEHIQSRIDHDLKYIQEASLAMDIAIIWKTFKMHLPFVSKS